MSLKPHLSPDSSEQYRESTQRLLFVTLNVAESELVARRVGMTWTCTRTRQEQLKRRTIGQRAMSLYR